MSLKLGSTSIGSLYLGSTKISEAYLGSTKVYLSGDPYNPLELPAFTIRCKFTDGYTPSMGTTRNQVSVSPNIWDITQPTSYWTDMFQYSTDLLEVLGANTTGVERMKGLFQNCTNLTSVALFDTSSVTWMDDMFLNCTSLASVPRFNTSSVTEMISTFQNCTSLTSVPLFNTSSVTWMDSTFRGCTGLTSIPLFDVSSAEYMDEMFYGCTAVQSGSLALYQQASALPNVPTHTNTFYNCGNNTQTGAAELAQIPQSWGGTYDPYNPLGLPPYTIRCKFSAGYRPDMGDSQTLVDSTNNVWDIVYELMGPYWDGLFKNNNYLLEVIGANTTGVVDMTYMFQYCRSLSSVPLFDTSSVRSMNSMFESCLSLSSVPLFDTSLASTVPYMFRGCTAVESGALALYQQMSTQATPPTAYTGCFTNCGSGNALGQAELAQIPASWGGTGA